MDAPLRIANDAAGDGLLLRRGSVLVIGYGNDLRGDDGAGLRVAQRLAEGGSAARVVGVRQLVPELAEEVAAAARVVFVDAYAANDAHARLRIERVDCLADRVSAASTFAHRSAAEQLLALAARLYGASPDAWLLAIPAFDFAAGAQISSLTALRIEAAVAYCRALPGVGDVGNVGNVRNRRRPDGSRRKERR